MDYFSKLPIVLFSYLFDSLFIEDICSMERTSKTIRNLIKEKEIWKKIYIQLLPHLVKVEITDEKNDWKSLYLKAIENDCFFFNLFF